MTALPPARSTRPHPTIVAPASSIEPGGAVRRAMGYRKFVGTRPLRVLLLESGYHVQTECRDALRRLGHTVTPVYIRLPTAAEVVRAVLGALVQHRPDMVLCINHLGFDDSGTIGGLLESLEVPVACWYVDSPFFVLRGDAVPGSRVTSIFTWERSLMDCLYKLGAQDVHYLPLGCDVQKFSTGPGYNRYPLSFVGNSMEMPGQRWTQDLVGVQRERAAQWKQTLIAKRQSLVDDALALHRAEGDGEVWDALAAATYSATGVVRAKMLKGAASAAPLHIFGDSAWRKVMPKARLHDVVIYGAPLARVYADSTINLNATSLQMPTAVNQRAFDVPAAGGFLLSDAQQDVGEHFELGVEAVTYDGPEHLTDLVRHYSKRPELRRMIVQRAQERIVREHTYEHRLQALVHVMRRRYGLLGRARREGADACVVPS